MKKERIFKANQNENTGLECVTHSIFDEKLILFYPFSFHIKSNEINM